MIQLQAPYYRQERDHTCGPAIVRMILKDAGIALTEDQLACFLDTGPLFGTRTWKMSGYLRFRGFDVSQQGNADFETILRALESGATPVVLYRTMDHPREKHFALVVGLSPTKIILHDPWYGQDYEMDRQTFYACWNDWRLGKRRWMMTAQYRKRA